MDPHHRGPEEQDAPGAARSRDDHDALEPARGRGLVPRPAAPAVVVPPYGTATPRNAPHEPAGQTRSASRAAQVVAGDDLLTVNAVDGSEVAAAPPERIPAPRRRSAPERAARDRAARPAPVAGQLAPRTPLLERTEEIERLIGLIGRGRSVRVTGPAGSGRTALLAEVANRCADLAPDGVIRLSGHRRTPADLLHDLYATVFDADGYRPTRARLLDGVRGIGAVVVLDDVEFGGAALEELLGAAAECAFLISAVPQAPAPSAGSHIEEAVLPGLSKAACARLLAHGLGRELTRAETSWADDLWFTAEGLPLRFVQAAALLRRDRDTVKRPSPGLLPSTLGLSPVVSPGVEPADDASRAQLPSPADAAAPAALLVAKLSRNAREALRVSVALGGECVDASHLPALVGAENADGALAELIACGLATPVAAHHRLAAGVLTQLAAGEVRAAGSGDYALTVARHFVWWAGHPSVPAGKVAAEADAIVAAMSACRDGGHHDAAVRLARTAAPEFAAGLNWSAWERALRTGLEAARLAGEVGEEAYFHHELGVLALCEGSLDRARSELEASIGMRGALGDRPGGLVGRRMLVLVNDRSGPSTALVPASRSAAVPSRALATRAPKPPQQTAEVPVVRRPAHALPPGATATTSVVAAAGRPTSHRGSHRRRSAVISSRRNLAAAGAGAVIAAVLGTVVTLGATSDSHPAGTTASGGAPARNDDNGVPADQPTEASSTSRPPTASASAGKSAVPSATVTPTATVRPGPTTTAVGGGGSHPKKPKPKPSKSRTSPPASTSPPPSSPPPTSPPPTSPPPTSPPPTQSTTASPAPSSSPTGSPTASAEPTATTTPTPQPPG